MGKLVAGVAIGGTATYFLLNTISLGMVGLSYIAFISGVSYGYMCTLKDTKRAKTTLSSMTTPEILRLRKHISK